MAPETTVAMTRPCKRGHLGRKYVKSRICVECRRITASAWSKAHPEKAREYMAAWRAANPDRPKPIATERRREQSREWQRNNRERVVAYVLAWQKRNRPAVNAGAARHNARKRNAPGRGVSAAQWRDCLAGSLGICAYCNEGKPLTMDHIEPTVSGGSHDVSNIAAACLSCNSSKSDTPLLLWLARRALARAA